MDTTDIMNDPAFTPILFGIERRIIAAVRSANAAGVGFNDSQIRSMLNKVRKTAEGGNPQMLESSPREVALANLYRDLLDLRNNIQMGDATGRMHGIPTQTWTLCIKTIEESIQHHSTGPGSHGYQEFLEDFIPNAEKAEP